MAATAFVRARVNEKLKDDATAILDGIGLTVSDVVRMTLTRIVRDKALPFELTTPNAETRVAMAESRAKMAARKARFRDGADLINALDQKIR
jgi:DNA-damage-inducible protein J